MKEKNENMSLIRNSIVPQDVEDILSGPTKWLENKVIHRAQKLIKKGFPALMVSKIHF